jgi:hypothetical protein
MRRLARLGLALALVSGAIVVLRWGGRLGPRPEPTRAGGRFRIVQCPMHGIAYDTELETCPECAKAIGTPGGGG